MTGSYHDSNWSEQITIPVRRVGDRWEFFYGGNLPNEGGLQMCDMCLVHLCQGGN
jgi:hypothetical protein